MRNVCSTGKVNYFLQILNFNRLKTQCTMTRTVNYINSAYPSTGQEGTAIVWNNIPLKIQSQIQGLTESIVVQEIDTIAKIPSNRIKLEDFVDLNERYISTTRQRQLRNVSDAISHFALVVARDFQAGRCTSSNASVSPRAIEKFREGFVLPAQCDDRCFWLCCASA